VRRLALAALALLITGPTAAQTCSGFPWTVTTSSSGSNVQAHICGSYVGCLPHAPVFHIIDTTITITLTQGAPPNCPCPGPPANFGLSAATTGVPPGVYDILVYTLDCQSSTLAGQTSIVVGGGASSIPTLDGIGIAALILLIGAAGLWRLRL
jgi:hypothetical protein